MAGAGQGLGRPGLGTNAKSQAAYGDPPLAYGVAGCYIGSMKTNPVREGKPGPGRPKGNPRRRVHVTMSMESWAMVEEIAELTGTPKAAILSEIFDATLPSFVATIHALRVAKEQPREAQRLVQNFAASSVMQLQQAQLEMDDLITRAEAEKKGKRRKKGVGDAGAT